MVMCEAEVKESDSIGLMFCEQKSQSQENDDDRCYWDLRT